MGSSSCQQSSYYTSFGDWLIAKGLFIRRLEMGSSDWSIWAILKRVVNLLRLAPTLELIHFLLLFYPLENDFVSKWQLAYSQQLHWSCPKGAEYHLISSGSQQLETWVGSHWEPQKSERNNRVPLSGCNPNVSMELLSSANSSHSNKEQFQHDGKASLDGQPCCWPF